mgnify:CR=1 FL=1
MPPDVGGSVTRLRGLEGRLQVAAGVNRLGAGFDLAYEFGLVFRRVVHRVWPRLEFDLHPLQGLLAVARQMQIMAQGAQEVRIFGIALDEVCDDPLGRIESFLAEI